MPLDPDAQILLDMVKEANRPAFETITPAEARALFMAGRPVLAPEPMPVAELRDLAIPGPAGAIPVRLYRPSAGGTLPALVFFHGGGWVVGDIESHDTVCRHLANRAGCVVVAVDYRLAPEHKFPAAVEDCLAAYHWLRAHGRDIGADPARVAVAGDSAGGNLSAVVSQLAAAGGTPLPRCQVLIYPAVDFSFDTDSYRDLADGHVIPRDRILWYAEQYLRDEADKADLR